MNDNWLTVYEVAEELDISVSTVRRMVKEGKVKYERVSIGNRGNKPIFIDPDSIKEKITTNRYASKRKNKTKIDYIKFPDNLNDFINSKLLGRSFQSTGHIAEVCYKKYKNDFAAVNISSVATIANDIDRASAPKNRYDIYIKFFEFLGYTPSINFKLYDVTLTEEDLTHMIAKMDESKLIYLNHLIATKLYHYDKARRHKNGNK